MNDMSPENSAINAIMPALKSPLALLYGVIIMGAFALSAHIQGYEDIYYLPANMLLVLAALIAIFPVFRNGLSIPATWPVFLVLAFWSFIAFSMSWSSVPYASLLMFAMFCALPVTFFGIILSPAREKFWPEPVFFRVFRPASRRIGTAPAFYNRRRLRPARPFPVRQPEQPRRPF